MNAPIPPLTDELIARLKRELDWANTTFEGIKPLAQVHVADLTTVLHHLAAYRYAVERWERSPWESKEYHQAILNLSAVHARAKGL